MVLYPPDKQTAGCNLPDNWLISFTMELALCVICGGENDTNVCQLAIFSIDVAFACHFMATHPSPILPSPTLPLHRSASVIGYISKKCLKWQAI